MIFRNYQLQKRCFSNGVLKSVISEVIEGSRAAGTYKTERVISSPQSSEISLANGGSKVLNMCANNYLGLASHPSICSAAIDAINKFGYGMSSVRFICGTQTIHKELEKQLSEFHGLEDTILYGSCFDANGGVFESLLTNEDAVISDELNHASIIDGIRLCKANRYRYKHLSMTDLADRLEEAKNHRMRLVVTDGVFSMDGDVAPLDKIAELISKYPNTYLMVDDCHGTGVFGQNGRGTPNLFGVKVDILNSTLGKALGGGTGGYTSGSSDIIDLLRQKSRPYLFSNSIAPAVVGASQASLKLLTQGPELQNTLMENTRYFRSHMHEAGFEILGNDDCPIVPVLLGDAKASGAMAEELLSRGIYVVSFSYPVVPKGQARIRVQISAAHTPTQLSKAVSAFISVGKELGVLERYTSTAFEQKASSRRK